MDKIATETAAEAKRTPVPASLARAFQSLTPAKPINTGAPKNSASTIAHSLHTPMVAKVSRPKTAIASTASRAARLNKTGGKNDMSISRFMRAA